MASFRNAGPVEHRLRAILQLGNQSSSDRGGRCAQRSRADSWRESRFETDLDKARASKHLRRRGVVMRHAAVDRPGRLDRNEGPKCLRFDRSQSTFVIAFSTHLRRKGTAMSEKSETAILAGGCFWPAQELRRHREGVISPASATPARRMTTPPPITIRVTPRRSRSPSIPRVPPTGTSSSSSSRSTDPTLARSLSAPTTAPRSSVCVTSSAGSPRTRSPMPTPQASGPARS